MFHDLILSTTKDIEQLNTHIKSIENDIDINVLNQDNSRVDSDSDFLKNAGLNILCPAAYNKTSTYHNTYNKIFFDVPMTGVYQDERHIIKFKIGKKSFVFNGYLTQKRLDFKKEDITFFYADSVGNGEEKNPEEFPLAALYNNILWFYWELNEINETNKAVILHVLKQVFKIFIEKNIPLKRDADTEITAAITEFYKDQFDLKKNNIIQSEERTKNLLAEYIQLKKQLDIDRKIISSYEESLNESLKNTDTFIKRLKRHPKIDSYGFENRSLIIKTKNLVLKGAEKYDDESREYNVELPPYIVHMNLNSGSLTVYIDATRWSGDSAITKRPHPHIYDNGSVCLGNFDSVYRDVLARGSFNQAIDIIIEFLQSYNHESPLINIWEYESFVKQLSK